jgi:hypothetical protein
MLIEPDGVEKVLVNLDVVKWGGWSRPIRTKVCVANNKKRDRTLPVTDVEAHMGVRRRGSYVF